LRYEIRVHKKYVSNIRNNINNDNSENIYTYRRIKFNSMKILQFVHQYSVITNILHGRVKVAQYIHKRFPICDK